MGRLRTPGSTVTIYVQPAARLVIVAAPAALSVTQGSAGTFGVTLSAAPPATVTITVDFTSGSSGVSVTSGGTLTLYPGRLEHRAAGNHHRGLVQVPAPPRSPHALPAMPRRPSP